MEKTIYKLLPRGRGTKSNAAFLSTVYFDLFWILPLTNLSLTTDLTDRAGTGSFLLQTNNKLV